VTEYSLSFDNFLNKNRMTRESLDFCLKVLNKQDLLNVERIEQGKNKILTFFLNF
jgi:hypothetical protein